MYFATKFSGAPDADVAATRRSGIDAVGDNMGLGKRGAKLIYGVIRGRVVHNDDFHVPVG